MEPITTPGGYVITQPIDIILISCNRVECTRFTINELHKRIKIPFRLIVVDDESVDGTVDMLRAAQETGLVDVLSEGTEHRNICQSYNEGFKHVESPYFFCMQDDITVPDLDVCVMQQMIDLMEIHPEQLGIGLRIQRIPNMNWQPGDITPARKSLSAYFRIQRKKALWVFWEFCMWEGPTNLTCHTAYGHVSNLNSGN